MTNSLNYSMVAEMILSKPAVRDRGEWANCANRAKWANLIETRQFQMIITNSVCRYTGTIDHLETAAK